MKIHRARHAFTLIELIIALSIFAVVAVLCSTAIVNSLKSAKKIQAETYLYSESQALMDRLAKDIEENGVDYEAYYLREVKGETLYDTQDYGLYSQAFYNPGSTDPSTLTGPYDGITGYGSSCADGSGYYPDDCDSPYSDYADYDMGTHPFTGISDFGSYDEDETGMNAFCESYDCTSLSYGLTDDLILINSRGDERTAYSLISKGGGEYQLGKVQLTGTDTDSDGVVDSWECTSRYTCSASDDGLTAITPNTINIESFRVLVSPSEDPYRAFGEVDIQIQPQVTLIFTATLSSEYGASFLGDTPTITLQRTLSTGVYSEIKSYE